MKSDKDILKNFLRFYLDPEIFTESETDQILKEMGVNIEKLNEKKENFIKKLEAQEKLKVGK